MEAVYGVAQAIADGSQRGSYGDVCRYTAWAAAAVRHGGVRVVCPQVDGCVVECAADDASVVCVVCCAP